MGNLYEICKILTKLKIDFAFGWITNTLTVFICVPAIMQLESGSLLLRSGPLCSHHSCQPMHSCTLLLVCMIATYLPQVDLHLPLSISGQRYLNLYVHIQPSSVISVFVVYHMETFVSYLQLACLSNVAHKFYIFCGAEFC